MNRAIKRRMPKGSGRLPCAVISLVVTLTLWLYIMPRWYKWRNLLSYGTRPLWDTEEGPQQIVPRLYAEGMPFDQQMCRLHGWDVNSNGPRELWDAVLFSTELDLLLIRLHSLKDQVSKHIIVLSDSTFTGRPLKTLLPPHTPSNPSPSLPVALKPFASKLYIYHFTPTPDPDPFVVERSQRHKVTSVLNELVKSSPSDKLPLVLMADVDELPAASTLALVRACKAPYPIHLQLEQYQYSFEWHLGDGSWRAVVDEWSPGTSWYGHSKRSDVLLAAAGWHCSFCFRYIDDFRTKMRGYSHNDRLDAQPNPSRLLTTQHIQSKVCNGEDLFEMLPEAYQWSDLLAFTHPENMISSVYRPICFKIPNNIHSFFQEAVRGQSMTREIQALPRHMKCFRPLSQRDEGITIDRGTKHSTGSMSHVRRVGGRFSTNAASESYQRQLVAPVNRWRKSWVVPAGLPAESSYKVCKWVRIIPQNGGKDESQHGSDSEGEDGTPAHGMELDVKEENGEETEQTQEAINAPSAGTMDTTDVKDDQPVMNSMDVDTPSVPQVTTTAAEVQTSDDVLAETATPADVVAPAAELLAVEPQRSRTRSKSPRSASPANLPPSPSHIPSNAVEVSLAAPTGHGGVPGPGGLSMHVPEVGENHEPEPTPAAVDVVSSDIVAPDVVVETVNESQEAAAPQAVGAIGLGETAEAKAEETIPERDEGVTMGVDDVPMLKGDDVAPEDME